MANNWRGCENVFMQGHGEWAAPDIYIENEDGLFIFNYYDIEDALWGDFLESEGIGEEDTYDERGNISDEWEEKFSEYCRNNAYDYITYDLLPEGGYFTDEQCSKDGKFCSWHTDDVKEYDAEQEEDEDDSDYDDEDIDESCSGDKKKVKKKLKEDINSGSKYPTSLTECLNLLASATKEFADAYLKLTEQWDMCDTYCQNDARESGLDIDINDAMVDGYPFERSFDDYTLEVMEWNDSVIEGLNNIRDTFNK